MNFIFIGYKNHLVDGIAYRIGKRLIKEGKIKKRNCFFCNGLNIEKIASILERRKCKTSIAVDICNITDESNDIIDRVIYLNRGVTPASGIRKQKIVLGNKGIMLNTTNIYEYEEGDWVSNLLQDTRSELIEKKVEALEEILYYACIATIEAYKDKEVIKCTMNNSTSLNTQ